DNLERALKEYQYVYHLDPRQHLWHGINVAALSARARRDNVPIADLLDASTIAEEILATLEEKEMQSASDLPAYDLATQLEAYVALGRYRDAAGTALRYVDSIDADAFEVSSTIRQLTEVWQLNYNEPPGNHLLPILKAAQLSKEGATSDRDAKHVMEEAVSVGAAVSDLERVFGRDRTVTLNWYKKGLEQCNSIARVERLDRRAHGTGWLVKASDFFPGREGVLFITAEHVISNDSDHLLAILPENAQANFQALGLVFKFKEIVWSSSYRDLDVTFVSLEGEPRAEPLILHERALQMTRPPAPPPRLYIIGHPAGRDLELSLQENHLLAFNDRVLHYRTPTESGSGGSPVFEPDDWKVVALHHKGSQEIPRIDGIEGTYEANEGIAISAIRKRTQQLRQN
ncbi:MAG TPA: serine protease, partial [Pyrinomonadaceae bacterium]|nr:serine protease [Pyrinomonadaceae bacterium]